MMMMMTMMMMMPHRPLLLGRVVHLHAGRVPRQRAQVASHHIEQAGLRRPGSRVPWHVKRWHVCPPRSVEREVEPPTVSLGVSEEVDSSASDNVALFHRCGDHLPPTVRQVGDDVLADAAAGDQLDGGQHAREASATDHKHCAGLDAVEGLAPGAVLAHRLLRVDRDETLLAGEMARVA